MPNKLLIVDDNAELLSVLRTGFKGAGFIVRTAANGPDAIKKARSFSPDLIVLDLVLPDMDGFAICEILKKDRETALIPIIVLTGLSSQLSRFAGLECGADDYVTKPFSFPELLGKVNELIERSYTSITAPAPCSAAA
jgi:two-component system, OmpR family, alkaline phosphatase synthesis response regulator PhoP